MTNKEKMLSGAFYDAWTADLVRERDEARRILADFNTSGPDEVIQRRELLNRLFQRETDCYIEPPFQCDYGYNIVTGKGFYANFGCTILDVNRVTIGDNVKFGPNVQVYSATHPTDPDQRLAGKEMGYPIEIGNNVWIGGGSIVCPGVQIGDHSVIGAGSVVVRDIPARVVAAGNPCRIIRQL